MDYFIDVSDKRNLVVKRLFFENGYDVKIYDPKKNDYNKNSCLIFSPAKKFLYNEVENLPNNIILFAGANMEQYIDILKSKNIKFFNIMNNEIFTIKNANLTAEGVLAIILEKSEKSIFKNRVLLLGSGRITKACAMLFAKLGVDYAIVSYTHSEYEKSYSICNECYFKDGFIENLKNFDVVVNTRPFKYIDENIINKIAKNTLFIETASNECLNKDFVKDFTYLLAPALPMKYSSITAGEVLFDRIMEDLND